MVSVDFLIVPTAPFVSLLVFMVLRHDRRGIVYISVTARPTAMVAAMGIEDVVTAPRSPWQNPYVERVIGSIHNHFNQDRHLNRRDIFKQNRFAVLVEWRQLAA